MYHRSYWLVPVIALILVMAAPSCKQKASTPEHLKEQVDMTSMEYASAYICPMHCKGSGSDQPGTCPVCKMDYVKNSKYTGETNEDAEEEDALTDSIDAESGVDSAEQQVLDDAYTCPMHPEISGKQGENCSTCGMELVKADHEDSDHY